MIDETRRDEIRREIRDLELKEVMGAEEFDERESEINDLLDQLVGVTVIEI